MSDDRPPWHGGNKIPDSYLDKFMPPRPDVPDDMDPELARFLEEEL